MPTTYPTADPPPEPPVVAEDDLDGVTREQLVSAEIEKHKEILTPDVPVSERLTELGAHMSELGNAFAGLHAVMQKMVKELKEIGNAIKNAKAGESDESRGRGPREVGDPAGDREGIRGGGQKEGDSGQEEQEVNET